MTVKKYKKNDEDNQGIFFIKMTVLMGKMTEKSIKLVRDMESFSNY